jgi:hypothetical protein
MGGRYGDHRNWPAIDAWADLIAAQLHVEAGVRPTETAGHEAADEQPPG